MIKSIATLQKTLLCENCSQRLNKCDGCNHVFEETQKIGCEDGQGEHYCTYCQKEIIFLDSKEAVCLCGHRDNQHGWGSCDVVECTCKNFNKLKEQVKT